MIPKVIHYCWFGGNPLPNDAVKCIESWRKYFHGYEIKQWNESNFDFNICDYTKEAYQEKKWAFVSDYARFWILYHVGGLYFDTDVEVIKDFTSIIERGAFMGCEQGECICNNKESEQTCFGINPGLGLGVAPGLGLYKEILTYYEHEHFLDSKGKFNGETVVGKTTKILIKAGFDPQEEQLQNIAGIWIYPPEYFCPMNYETGKVSITPHTYSIHHYTASWQNPSDHFKSRIKKLLGKRMSNILSQLKEKLLRV